MDKNEDNQHGKTITIKHFLNKRLKPRAFFHDGKIYDAYPLYLQVSVKRQNTKIRSKIYEYIPEELFNDFLEEKKIILSREASDLRENIRREKPFEKDNFILSSALQNIRFSEIDLHIIIRVYIENIIKEALESDIRMKYEQYSESIESDLFSFRSENFIEESIRGTINSLADDFTIGKMIVCKTSNFPSIDELYSKHSPLLWQLKYMLVEIEKKTTEIITIREWQSGNFDDYFLQTWPDKALLVKVKDAISSLLKDWQNSKYVYEEKGISDYF